MRHRSDFLAYAGDVGDRNDGTTITKGITDITSDVCDPLVVVHRHRNHLGVVGLSSDRTSQAVKKDANDGVTVTADIRGIRQGRRDSHAGLGTVHRHTLAVVTVASEAEFTIDGLTTDQLVIFLFGVIPTANGIVTNKYHGTEFLHTLGGGGHEGLLDELGAIGPCLNLV